MANAVVLQSWSWTRGVQRPLFGSIGLGLGRCGLGLDLGIVASGLRLGLDI